MPDQRRKRVGLYSTPANLRKVDERSTEGRFMAAVRASLTDQMGGPDKVSYTESRIIHHIAQLELLVELGNAKLVKAVEGEGLGIHKDLSYLIGKAIDAMTKLGLDRAQRPTAPTLAEYVELKLVGSS